MSTVRETFGLACPNCGCDEDLSISVQIWVDIFPDGTLESRDSHHEWDDRSPCWCTRCKYDGNVSDFTTGSGGAS